MPAAGIRTRNPNNSWATGPRFRRRGHWDRLLRSPLHIWPTRTRNCINKTVIHCQLLFCQPQIWSRGIHLFQFESVHAKYVIWIYVFAGVESADTWKMSMVFAPRDPHFLFWWHSKPVFQMPDENCIAPLCDACRRCHSPAGMGDMAAKKSEKPLTNH
jgi:hypothetical protein